MKKIAILLVLAIPLLQGCGDEKKEHNTLNTAEAIPVRTAVVGSFTLTGNISASGLVTTEHQGAYSFKIGGVISRIYVEEGQFFKKGQLLAELDATEIAAGLNQANLNVEKYERDYSRASNLYKDSVYTLEQLQNTKTGLDIARKQKEAVAFNARYAKIYATADGFVAHKIANEGEVVGPGSPVVAINETANNDNYLLKVGLTDKEWAAVRIGQMATVTLDGFPGKGFKASVLRKSQAADAALGSFQVELRLELNGVKPAVGMFGKADIKADNAQDCTVIPYDALVEADGDKAFVFTIEEGKVSRKPVIIAKFENSRVYIKEGLESTDQLVVSNSAYLNEHSKITIIK